MNTHNFYFCKEMEKESFLRQKSLSGAYCKNKSPIYAINFKMADISNLIKFNIKQLFLDLATANRQNMQTTHAYS